MIVKMAVKEKNIEVLLTFLGLSLCEVVFLIRSALDVEC